MGLSFKYTFKGPLIAFAVCLALGVLADQAFNAYIQLSIIYILVNILMAMSLNLVNGYTGQFSLGHAGFMAVGAYTSAFLAMRFPPTAFMGGFPSYLIYGLLGGLMAAGAGYLVGLPSLRLKGDYLAIVTLGFGEIIRVVVLNTDALGGARGMFGIPGPAPFEMGIVSISRFLNAYTLSIMWVVVAFYVLWRIIHSTHGRAFMSIREDEIASESMGVNTTGTKVRAFVLSSFFAGVAGSIFAHYSNYLNPSTFSLLMSINAVIMVVMGGMGGMSGPIIAAIIVTILPEALRPLQELTGKDLRMVIYSLILILMMLVRPQGIMGHLEVTDVLKKIGSRLRGKTST